MGLLDKYLSHWQLAVIFGLLAVIVWCLKKRSGV